MRRETHLINLKNSIMELVSAIAEHDDYQENILSDPYYIYNDDDVHGLEASENEMQKCQSELIEKVKYFKKTVNEYQIHPKLSDKEITNQYFTEIEKGLLNDYMSTDCSYDYEWNPDDQRELSQIAEYEESLMMESGDN